MKVLVVKTSSMGDVIHALPALTEARAARPDLVVDWAVEPAFADIVGLHPGVRRIWPTPVRRWRTEPVRAGTWREVGALRRALRDEHYELVLDAQGLLKSALIARLAGGPVSGLSRASSRGGLVAALYGRRHAVSLDLHAVDRARLLFAAALGYRVDLEAPAPVLATGASEPIADGRALLVHGTTWPSKRWPLPHWIAVADGLARRGLKPTVTFADAAEERFAERLVAAVPAVEVVGRRPLAEVAALVGASALVIGVDTGLTHLAAATGRPTIALFASTAPGQTGPRGPRATSLMATIGCAPCGKRVCPLVPAGVDPPCHRTVAPEAVLAEVDAWAGAGRLARSAAL